MADRQALSQAVTAALAAGRNPDGVEICVAGIIPNGHGGATIATAYAGMAVANAEGVARALLTDVAKSMEEADREHCPACARRWARITGALAALELGPEDERRGLH